MNDPLREILSDLGDAPEQGFDGNKSGSEIVLDLKNRFAKIDGSFYWLNSLDAALCEIRQLLKETKKMVVAVISINAGPTLLDTLEAPVTLYEEEAFVAYLDAEEARQSGSVESLNSIKSNENVSSQGFRGSLSVSINQDGSRYSIDFLRLFRMTFSQLKRKTLENMHKLEKDGEANKENKYQDMIDSLIEVR
jgi:hypothetical protein